MYPSNSLKLSAIIGSLISPTTCFSGLLHHLMTIQTLPNGRNRRLILRPSLPGSLDLQYCRRTGQRI